jgi:hypothetical protein
MRSDAVGRCTRCRRETAVAEGSVEEADVVRRGSTQPLGRSPAGLRSIRIGSALIAGLLAVAAPAQAVKGKGKPEEQAPKDAAAKKDAAPAPAQPVAKPAAPRPATWEELSRDAAAEAPEDLGPLVEPLFATCAKDSDLAYRQCETIKEWLTDRLHAHHYLAVADGAALQSSPYDAAEKALTLTVNGCVACLKPPAVDGALRLIATRPPRGFSDGTAVGIDVGFHEVSLDDAKKAEKWATKVLPRLRVEWVFTVGQPFEAGATKGVAIVPLGHRVYNSCTGEVVASDPASAKPRTVAKDPTCPALGAPTEEEVAEAREQAALPDRLTPDDIERAMAPVQQRVLECATEFELKGVAKVSLVLNGDGTRQFKVLAPFDKGEANLCIRQAMKLATFPHFKKGKTIPIDYPFVLHQ